MPKFDYTAQTAGGKSVKGRLEAANYQSCVRELRAKGYKPKKILRSNDKGAKKEKIGPTDLELFTGQLSIMLDSGVALLNALATIYDLSEGGFKAIVGKMREDVAGGKPMSASMRSFPRVFDSMYCGLVEMAEQTGAMGEVLRRLAEHLEFERGMREKTMEALRYPMIVIVVMLAAVGVANFFVIPAFAKAFAQFGAQLPMITRMLIGFSNFLISFGAYIGLAGAGAFLAAKRWSRTAAGRMFFGKWRLKLPIFGELALKTYLARYAGGMALAERSGLPIDKALKLVAPSTGNDWLGMKFGAMLPAIERGESLFVAATATGVFTPIALQMIALGEETGNLDKLLGKVAALYKSEVDRDLKAIGAKMEPVIMVMLGVLVLILALGVMLPIWDLGSTALHGMKKH